jgi:hypothetical protein
MIEFIAHTAPEAKIPSKNIEYHSLVPNKVFVGEKNVNDRKNPTQVLVHIIQDTKSDINLKINLKGNPSVFPITFINCLGALNIEP